MESNHNIVRLFGSCRHFDNDISLIDATIKNDEIAKFLSRTKNGERVRTMWLHRPIEFSVMRVKATA
jgi:hypothetical protein